MVDVVRDPNGMELTKLRQSVEFKGARILEIGCGDGRVTWQYADLASRVCAIDPDLLSLRSASENRPDSLGSSLFLIRSEAESLPFARKSFDIAILAWSL